MFTPQGPSGCAAMLGSSRRGEQRWGAEARALPLPGTHPTGMGPTHPRCPRERGRSGSAQALGEDTWVSPPTSSDAQFPSSRSRCHARGSSRVRRGSFVSSPQATSPQGSAGNGGHGAYPLSAPPNPLEPWPRNPRTLRGVTKLGIPVPKPQCRDRLCLSFSTRGLKSSFYPLAGNESQNPGPE